MPLTRIKNTAIGDDGVTTQKLDDTTGGFTLPGVQFVKVPVGTTAQRPGTPAGGHLRFNTTLGVLEQYNLNTNAWASIDSPPLISSLAYAGSATAADPAGGETITLTGSNFQAGATVTVGGTSASSVAVPSTTSITFTTPAKTAGDYDVVVTNANGLAATLSNGISYNGVPAFTTAAGNVGELVNNTAMSTITIVVAEPDGGSVTQSITSGALPTGLSMSTGGAITGTPNVSITDSTTYNFTVTGTDDENQTNARAFNLIVLREIYNLQIPNSLRFDGSGYLTKTPSGAGNRKLWTWAGWVRRAMTNTFTLEEPVFLADADANNYVGLKFSSTNELQVTMKHTSQTGGSSSTQTRRKITKQRFEDSSAWYHILVNFDAANQTCDIYVNGERINKYSTNEQPQNYDFAMSNASVPHYIGHCPTTRTSITASTFNGVMSDVYFIDGQALTPSSFTDTYRGVLTPKAYTGTYGTNGYHLTFADSTNLGDDTSGQSNDYSASAMNAHDQIKGSPTNNFCSFNENATRLNHSVIDFTQGGYKFENTTVHKTAFGNQTMTTGKWYWEARATGGNKFTAGVTDVLNIYYEQANSTNYIVGNSSASDTYGAAVGFYADNIYKNGSTVQSGVFGAYAANDILMVAYDADNGYVYFGRNGTWNNGAPGRGTAGTTWQGTSSYDTTVNAAQTYVPAFSLEQPSKWTVNWGQDSTFAGTETAGTNTDANGIGEFKYVVPTGFLALTSKNKADSINNNVKDETPQKRFNMAAYVGDAATSRAITGLGFSPDLVWFGNRSATRSMYMYDTVRGATYGIPSDEDHDNAAHTNGLLSFDSDGFTIGNKNNSNGNNETMIAWCWKAGGAPTATNVAGAGNAPTSGSVVIDGVASTAALAGTQPAKKISASNKTGLSIVLFDGTGSNLTVAHGLNGAPEMVWAKSMTTGTQNFMIQHKDIQTSGAEVLYLNLDSAGGASATLWNNTLADSTVVSFGTGNANSNGSETIMYCWKNVPGMTKTGFYRGNANAPPNGVYVHLGFKPALVAVKSVTQSGEWIVYDNVRHDGGNYRRYPKYWSINNPSEGGINANRYVDFLANGFMVHGGTATGLVSKMNNEADYIYLAFAEDPFKYAEAE
tara:strand:- start:294 stop:3647 length:3354 start_codon:yes stop_codon:yes gene_type:complete